MTLKSIMAVHQKLNRISCIRCCVAKGNRMYCVHTYTRGFQFNHTLFFKMTLIFQIWLANRISNKIWWDYLTLQINQIKHSNTKLSIWNPLVYTPSISTQFNNNWIMHPSFHQPLHYINPSIYNIIRCFAGPMTHWPSVWCSKYFFFS